MTTDTEMTVREATDKIAELTVQARELITKAKQIASAYDLSFSLDVTYGAGAMFCDGEWVASSQQC